MNDFSELGLPQSLLNSLKRMNYITPTPIQAQAIPVALTGKDILGSAQTGTGKTVAFVVPLLARLLAAPHESALVLTPTRDLATQVKDAIHALLDHGSNLKTVLIIGGESIMKQIQQLRANPRIFVGTPGRINDHLMRGTLKLQNTHFLVLDETDRMLDMGFGIQLDRIAKHLPKDRQTLMFSATMPANIVKLSEKYLTSPERISMGSTTTPIAKIKQEIIHTSEAEKYGKLLTQLTSRTGSIIVFVKTKWGAEKLAGKLEEFHTVGAIHGDLRQHKRDKVIQSFRNQKHRIMVATDIASRGLDIPHIEHVINYDLPQCPEDYIHRIGRTGRAGAEGEAVCFITPQDGKKWKAIHHLMHPDKKFEEPRSFQRSDQKKRSFSSGKPFQSSDRASSDRPFRSSERSSSDRPFKSSEKSSSDRPFRSSERSSSDRPFRSSERSSSDRPFKSSERSSSDRPFKSSERSSSDRPFKSSERSSSDRPFKSSERSSSDRPFKSSERSSSDRPFKPSTRSSDKPFKSSEKSSDKPFKKHRP